MNNQSSLKQLVSLLALAVSLTATAVAQQAPAPATIPPATTNSPSPTSADLNYGLLGQSYSGVRYSYVHHIDSAPSALHRYGFVSNASYARGLDTAFNYDYRTGSSGGTDYQWHDVGAAFTGFLTDLGAVRPFVTGAPGWRWQRIGNSRENGFAYLAGVGAEIAVARDLGVAPYANYQASPRLHEHGWLYGANTTYRFSRAWSGLFGAEMDERHNLAYTLGANRHF